MESLGDGDDWFLFSGLSDENPQEISNGTDVNPREICKECQRPTKTCWCSSLPNPPIGLSSRVDKVIIFQHPKEVKRPHQVWSQTQSYIFCSSFFASKRINVQKVCFLHSHNRGLRQLFLTLLPRIHGQELNATVPDPDRSPFFFGS